jgi:integrase
MGQRHMTRIKLQYIHEFRDRHGKLRRYVRLPNGKRVPLPGAPGTDQFMAAYQAALAGEAAPPRSDIGAGRTQPGTINAAVISYFNSSAFAALAPGTRRGRRNILERFREEHGDKRVALLQRSHIDRMVAAKAGTPAAARNFLNTVRALMAHCIAVDLRNDDPSFGVKRPSIKTDGFRTWTEGDIEAFEARHAIGTRARLTLALLLYTAQRRSDIVRLGPQHISGGVIRVRQQKTGTTLAIPVHPALAAVLEATPSAHLTFLTTKEGKPFSAPGFTNWFREMCNEAGLPRGTSAHGLRKAACRRLAEAGCSANVIASISGHASLREVQRYTAAADQARMARTAIDTVASAFPTKPTTRTSSGKPR